MVQAILDTCQPLSSDATWHGTCLALAEFAQRGLLLPTRLHDAVPLVAQALTFDLRRGGHSVGAHVRDAAAYVCWACARAYDASVLQAAVVALTPVLMTTACFDREVNCRRSADGLYWICCWHALTTGLRQRPFKSWSVGWAPSPTASTSSPSPTTLP